MILGNIESADTIRTGLQLSMSRADQLHVIWMVLSDHPIILSEDTFDHPMVLSDHPKVLSNHPMVFRIIRSSLPTSRSGS
jgi:hypothetical protein